MSTITVSAGGFPRSGARRGEQAQRSVGSRPASGASRMRLTRRGRVVLVALGLVLAGGIGSVATQAVAEGPAVEAATTTVIVAPGETLWSIASSIAEPGDDVRDVVAVIADLNELASLELRAGEPLLLPAA